MRNTCISLLTDFGLQDSFVGVMKGVILGIAPDVRLVDVTHLIQPQNVLQAAFVLEKSFRYFPEGSVHLAVVDPGVGTGRAGLAARISGHYFVTPDNGLLTCVIDAALEQGEAIKIIKLEESKYWLPEVSRTFHGRDIFAPVAAHLATGIAIEEFGNELNEIVRLHIPKPSRNEAGWQAHVVMSDIFGNLITNLRSEHLRGSRIREVRIGGSTIRQIKDTFGEAETGQLIVFFDSDGRLSISQVNGNASETLKVVPGVEVQVILLPQN